MSGEIVLELKAVAYYHGPFGSKFGIPRQSGLSGVEGRIVFEKEFRSAEALKGIEGFDRLWLIWGFSANPEAVSWHPTVRPPRLGGNQSVGVWATRSPFRPNPLGLSCVEFAGLDGLDILIRGADLMDGTPVYDIKPYVVYADSFPDAARGFVDGAPAARLKVVFPEGFPLEHRAVLEEVLSMDPRPAYQDEPGRIYGFPFYGRDLRFRVVGDTLEVLQWDIKGCR